MGVVPSYSHESSSPSYKQTHEPSHRHKRAADKKDEYDEDGKDKDDDEDEEEEETEVSTETWINLAESLSLIAKKLDDDDGEDDDDDEDDDDEEVQEVAQAPLLQAQTGGLAGSGSDKVAGNGRDHGFGRWSEGRSEKEEVSVQMQEVQETSLQEEL